jgi:RimJ/RimL family protein N-acetyltransferase
MAVDPTTRCDPAPPCRLVPFEPRWAAAVASWPRDAREAYWLAPKTRPPLTADEVLRWRKPDHDPYMLLLPERDEPVGYGELNRVTGVRRQYWLGHLVVATAERGRGLGLQLTRLLLQEAFAQRGARRVTLVVFPDNLAALRCYRAAGMLDDGYEWHRFPAYGRRECLLRLAAVVT